MSSEVQAIELRTSPHLKASVTTDQIMLNVVYALVPVCLFSVYAFGLSALALLLVTTAACVLTEHIACKVAKNPTTVSDYSVVITGVLLALTLPPGLPLWMAALGGVFGVLVGKVLFGGLGSNKFNPALLGRAFLQAAFPVAITTWTPAMAAQRFTTFIPTTLTLPFMSPAMKAEAMDAYVKAAGVDGWTGATPLSLIKFEGITTEAMPLFTGMTAGSAGETCSILILLGGLYLIARGMMNWRIPVAMLGAVAAISWLAQIADKSSPSPVFMLFSGGLMLGAMFMATDMVASPTSPLGAYLYGAIIGFLTVLIRLKGGLPEGVMYAILLGNALSPHIENMTRPRVYGTTKVKPQQ